MNALIHENLCITLKSILVMFPWSSADRHRVAKYLNCCCTPEVGQNHSAFLFQLSYHKHILFTFLCFLMVISLVQIAPKHGAEMLSALPKHRKVMKHLKKKICMLNNLHSSMSYSAVDHRFHVNELTVCIK